MTSHPLIRLVPRDELQATIDAYLDDLAIANRSPATIRFYRTNLERFRRWCELAGIPLDPVQHTKPMLRQFLRYLQSDERWERPGHHMANRAVTSSTVDAYYRSLRAYYNWLVDEEYIDRSPMHRLTHPTVLAEQPDPFSAEELERLTDALTAAGDGELPERNRAVIAILLDLGLRGSELAALRVQDVDLSTGDLLVVSGKGRKSRQLRLGARARKPVRRYWLRYRRQHGEQGNLFLSVRGTDITRDTVHDLTTRLGRQAQVEPCNPHRFRHTMAITAVRAGMDLLQLQAILGHTDLTMVRRYVKLASSDVIRASQQHSPLDHLKLTL